MKEQSKFVQVCYKLTDMVILNAVFVLCCLPVVSIGAAAVGLYDTAMRMGEDRDSGHICRTFFRAFRRSWKQATVIWGILLLLGGALVLDFRIAERTLDGLARSLTVGALCAAGFVYLGVFTCVFPLIAQFENTTGQMLRNALRLSMGSLRYTIPAMLLNLSPLLVLLVPLGMVRWFLAAFCFIWFSGTAYWNGKLFRIIFAPLICEADETQEPPD